VTLAAQIGAGAEALGEPAYFCPFGRCEVVYFDLLGRVVMTDALSRGVYPKDLESPICACFGLTEEHVLADVREGRVRRVRELIEKAKSPAAACVTTAPSGQSCVADVQRCYLQLRERFQLK